MRCALVNQACCAIDLGVFEVHRRTLNLVFLYLQATSAGIKQSHLADLKQNPTKEITLVHALDGLCVGYHIRR
jgi:hypothetical protein